MAKEVCKECGSAWYTDVRNECVSEKCSIGIKNLRKSYISRLDSRIEETTLKLRELILEKNFLEKYDDLYIEVHRWNKECYCSRMVNSKVTHADIRFNCGCCSDSPLEVFPYLIRDGRKVYSSPSCFVVGEKYGFGVSPDFDWEKDFKDNDISDDVINEIKIYLEKNNPDDLDWDDD